MQEQSCGGFELDVSALSPTFLSANLFDFCFGQRMNVYEILVAVSLLSAAVQDAAA